VKKLILLVLVAVGVGVLVKNKSEQLKAGAAKVTSDPRVQSALATASERSAPLKEKVDAAQERIHHARHDGADLTPPAVPTEAAEVASEDPVSAPEFSGSDPLTDPLPNED
jgi:dihydroxyacetone kinase